MSKIEPMSIEEIKQAVIDWENGEPIVYRLILTLVYALAQAKKSEAWLTWIMNGKEGPSPSMFLDSYITAVKAEIGWPESD